MNMEESKEKTNTFKNIVYNADKTCPQIIDYMMTFENLCELYKLIDVFNYSYERIKVIYSENDPLAMNAHTMTLLSAGKMIEESIIRYSEYLFGENDVRFLDLRKKISAEYDREFSFRFLIKLRDFSEHGHVPVSFQDGSYCFDLIQIYNTSFFTFKPPIKKEMRKYIERIKEDFSDTATLDYKHTVMLFVCSLYRVYNMFLDSIREIIIEKRIGIFSLIKANDDWLNHDDAPELEGKLCFTVGEDSKTIHYISIYERPIELYKEVYDNISKRLDYEMDAFKEYYKKVQITTSGTST